MENYVKIGLGVVGIAALYLLCEPLPLKITL